MKRNGLIAAVTFICAVFVMSSFPIDRAHAADVYNIKVSNFFPPQSKQSKITEEFAKELEWRSGGRIKTQYFAGGSLLTGPAMYKGIEAGITDIGYSHVYYTAGRFLQMEGTGLTLGVPSGWVGAHVTYDYYQKFQPKEFDKVKVLCFHGNGPSLMITTKPVKSLDDLKGLTIRAPGVAGEIVSALGGTPAPTPMMETYDALAKGVVQGVFAPYETLKSFRFAEVAKYVTDCWQIGATFPFYLAMNKNSYNKLPRDLQELVDAMAGEYQERYALMWNEIDFEGKAFGKEKGVNFIDLTDEQAAKWEAAVGPVVANYEKTMVSKGFPEAEIKDGISYMKDRIKYWTEKQEEYRVPSPTGPAAMRPEAYVQ